MDPTRRLGPFPGILALVLVLCCLCGCDRPSTPQPGFRGLRVVVSIPPLAGLVEALVPESSEVLVLVKAGQSPHSSGPNPSDIAKVGQADLVVLVGMGMESSLPASVRSGAKVVVMAEALGLEDAGISAHRPHDEHTHGEGDADPHLWLDPVLVAEFVPVLAARVREAARDAGLDASVFADITERESAFLSRVLALDEEYRRKLQPFAGSAVITHHTAWSRLADRYNLTIAAVLQVVEDTEPSPGHIAGIVAVAKEQPVRAVFTETQLDARIAERIADQLAIPVGRLDPLGTGDWEAMMRANLAELLRVLSQSHQPDEHGAHEPESAG